MGGIDGVMDGLMGLSNRQTNEIQDEANVLHDLLRLQDELLVFF